jgi:hypothetical protein
MWWLGPAAFGLIVLFFIYRIFFVTRERGPDESVPKGEPLPVAPERSAIGVLARLRIPELASTYRVERWARHLAWHPDGTAIVGATARGLRVWDAENGTWRKVGQLRCWGSGPVHALAWSGRGERLAIVNHNPYGDILHLVSFPDMTIEAHHKLGETSIERVAISPDDDLVAWQASGRFGVWDPATDDVRIVDDGQGRDGLTFVRRGGGIPALLHYNGWGTLEYHDPGTMERIEEVPVETNRHWHSFVGGGAYACYTYHDGVGIRDARTGELLAELALDEWDVECAWAERDLEAVVLGRKRGRIVIWKPKEEARYELSVFEDDLQEIHGTEDGRLVATAGFDITVAEVFSRHGLENAARARSGG